MVQLFRCLGVIAGIATAFNVDAPGESLDPARPGPPNNRVQHLLDYPQIPDPRTAEFYERIAAILRVTNNDLERVLDQVFLYMCDPPPDADTDVRAWVSMFVLATVFANEQRILLDGLASRLESENQQVRHTAREWTILFMDRMFTSSHIVEYVQKHGEEASYPLLTLSFERGGEMAFQAMLRLTRDSRLARGLSAFDSTHETAIRHAAVVEHAKHLPIPPDPELADRARESLHALSESDLWWARTYAIGTMNWYGRFRDRDTLNRLRNDEHPIVRELVERLDRRP